MLGHLNIKRTQHYAKVLDRKVSEHEFIEEETWAWLAQIYNGPTSMTKGWL
jgi:hypothetical protein